MNKRGERKATKTNVETNHGREDRGESKTREITTAAKTRTAGPQPQRKKHHEETNEEKHSRRDKPEQSEPLDRNPQEEKRTETQTNDAQKASSGPNQGKHRTTRIVTPKQENM